MMSTDKPPPSPREYYEVAAAIHEAGHAVAMVVVGLGCAHVEVGISIDPVLGPVRGLAKTATPLGSPRLGTGVEAVAPHLTQIWAGAAAERLLHGAACGGDVDREIVWVTAEALFPLPEDRQRCDKLLSDTYAAAERLVREHAGAIRAVADELRRRGRLSGDEVAAIVTEHSPRVDIAEAGPPAG